MDDPFSPEQGGVPSLRDADDGDDDGDAGDRKEAGAGAGAALPPKVAEALEAWLASYAEAERDAALLDDGQQLDPAQARVNVIAELGPDADWFRDGMPDDIAGLPWDSILAHLKGSV